MVDDEECAGLSDLDLLTAAARLGRALLTEDVGDFAPLARWLAGGDVEHAGIVLVSAARWPRSPCGLPRLASAIAALMDAHPADDALHGATLWLPEPPGR